ncbi:hypothetical protein TRP8649_02311 [Pelagimonas phthalicica]|uniref:Uncharacterized protein n=1 Tax=Pelagimonas phthalicica TaxID=1037362 RepID=A0A238JEC8_9RHOB|nr:hypothetical protein [Pelagimonas phthalicica]TDS91149.1 hypothetical protein CLV87_2313 [Pelagimonas phthalicica]SMX28196.1 hypothetical protein TRP8649_02311 [Pelagimonas phthalicica]
MPELVQLQNAEALADWILDAAHAYGKTLVPNAQTGDVPEAIDRKRADARDVLEKRRRALDPVPYDGEDYFHRHVSQALGTADALSNPDHPRAGMPDRTGPLREVLERLLLQWVPSQGAATLYLLLDLARRHRLEPAVETVHMLLARGQVARTPADWHKAIGRKAVAIAYEFAPSTMARNLLKEMPNRNDYWSPDCSVMTAAGLVQAEPDNWYTHLSRFQPELATLKLGAQRSALRQVVAGAGFRNVLIGSSAILPYTFDPDGRPATPQSYRHMPTLELLFKSAATPIKTGVAYTTLYFQTRDAEFELPEIAKQPEVHDAYRAALGQDWDTERTLDTCSYSYMYLAGVSADLSVDAGLRRLHGATKALTKDLDVLGTEAKPPGAGDADALGAWGELEALEDLYRADNLLDEALWLDAP